MSAYDDIFCKKCGRILMKEATDGLCDDCRPVMTMDGFGPYDLVEVVKVSDSSFDFLLGQFGTVIDMTDEGITVQFDADAYWADEWYIFEPEELQVIDLWKEE